MFCPTGKRRIDYFDTRLPGLLIKASDSGRRSYYIRYVDTHGRTKEKRFADAGIMSLADARNKAKELLARLSLGDDPFVEKNQRRTVPTYRDFILKRYLNHTGF